MVRAHGPMTKFLPSSRGVDRGEGYEAPLSTETGIRSEYPQGASSLPMRPRRKMSSCPSNQLSVSDWSDSARHIYKGKQI